MTRPNTIDNILGSEGERRLAGQRDGSIVDHKPFERLTTESC